VDPFAVVRFTDLPGYSVHLLKSRLPEARLSAVLVSQNIFPGIRHDRSQSMACLVGLERMGRAGKTKSPGAGRFRGLAIKHCFSSRQLAFVTAELLREYTWAESVPVINGNSEPRPADGVQSGLSR
jgi:hypothetical protein